MGSLHRMAVLCGLTVVLATSTAQAEDWKIKKDEDGIKISLSEVAGSDYKAYPVSYTHLTLPTNREV